MLSQYTIWPYSVNSPAETKVNTVFTSGIAAAQGTMGGKGEVIARANSYCFLIAHFLMPHFRAAITRSLENSN